MNKTSWRHHYIPEFYLDGFTSSNGMFKIYDVKAKKFKKNGKEFSPRTQFFEKNGNSWISEDLIDDTQETKYSKIDNRVAEVFQRIHKSNAQDKFNIDNDDIALLQYFVGVMYWRTPINYSEIKDIIQKKELKELGLVLKKIDDSSPYDIKEFEERIKNDSNFFKMMKFWFPNISFHEIFNCSTPLHIIPFFKTFPSVCSDNPVISKEPKRFRVYNDDFIFPLSDTTVFLRGEKVKKLNGVTKMLIDTLQYKQALEIVSCTDEKYLEQLDSFYDKNFSDLKELRELIFKQVFE